MSAMCAKEPQAQQVPVATDGECTAHIGWLVRGESTPVSEQPIEHRKGSVTTILTPGPDGRDDD
jgi:hypothetical protein